MSHSISRGVAALALGGFISLTGITAAHADTCPDATYPPAASCSPVTLTDSAAAPGAPFTVTLTGFKPNTYVDVYMHSDPRFLGRFLSDAQGNVTVTLTTPTDLPNGQHTLSASGIAPDGTVRVDTAPFTIDPKAVTGAVTTGTGSSTATSGVTSSGSTSATGSMPYTGFEVGAVSLLGVGLLGAGALAVASGRKRKVAASS